MRRNAIPANPYVTVTTAAETGIVQNVRPQNRPDGGREGVATDTFTGMVSLETTTGTGLTNHSNLRFGRNRERYAQYRIKSA